MKLVFAGTPDFAVPSLRRLTRAGHEIAAVITRPDKPRGRGHKMQPTPVKEAAQELDLPLIQPSSINDEECVGRLEELAPQLIAVVAYGDIIKPRVLELPPHGVINLHASALPAYRGAAPINRAIMDGAEETGVTIIRMVEEMDAGPILDKRTVPIGADETAGELHDELATEGARLLEHVVDRIDADDPPEETPQDESQVTFAPKLERGDRNIDWSLPAATIKNHVRGLTPWPGARCYLRTDDGKKRITLVAVDADETPDESDRPPGTVLDITESDELAVKAGRGRVIIKKLKPAGSRAMSAKDFLHGHSISPGDRFA